MKLAIQQTLLPGDDLVEKFKHAAAFGFDGVEITAWGFPGPVYDHEDEIREAMDASGLAVSTLCPSGDDDFVHPDPAERARRLAGLVRTLSLAEALGARGAIALPIRNPMHLPDLSPVASERALITDLSVVALASALEATRDAEARILLEPLNRYEATYLRTLADGVALCERVADPRVRIMADLFHMNIEENRVDTALKEAGSYVGHVHLADSNRLQPGQGHTDFVAAFRALRAIEFDGWMALECGIAVRPSEALPETVAFLREAWQAAEGT